MAKVNHFCLLLWKNYLLQRRKVIVTCFEIGLPTLFAVILILIRQRVESQNINTPTTWPTFKINTDPGYSQLFYSPNTTDLPREIIEKAVKRLPGITDVFGFVNEKEAVDTYLELLNVDNFLAIVSFVNVPKNAEEREDLDVEYKIRFPSLLRSIKEPFNPLKNDKHWNTEFMFPMFQKVGPRQKDSDTGGPPDYMKEGFLPLQYAIDMAIVDVVGQNSNLSGFDLWMQRVSYPPYIDDNFVLVIQQQFPMIIMLSFIFYSMQIVKDLVYEKEQKLKESMKMMGLSGWLHWLAWFVKYFVFIVISIAIETLLFCVNTGEHGRVIGYTSPSVLFVFLLLYGVTTILFCFALSTFFSKANSSSAIGGLVFFVSYVPYFFLQPRYDIMPWPAKIASCLLPNVAMALGTQVIGMFEGTGAGVQWSTINHPATVDDDFTMFHVMVMLIIDGSICAVIAWYVEAVFPGDFGMPQPFYFPFQRSYWCGMRQVTDSEDDEGDCHALETDPLLGGHYLPSANSEFFDRDPCDLHPGVQIQNLRKEFKCESGTKVAVAGMTLNLYEGQITALLGHNGAGKTTTMSILTGFFPPTSGTALINGYDILKDIGSVRSSLGLCPQHNVLFDSLTVEEHLIFFTKLKGHPKELVKSEVERTLTDIDLVEKRDSLASTLSGGMKRKLSIGIALSGGSKVVILDEPSSGLDPNARHHLWDLLLRNRTGRTILLSTHFMDEADALGDRIAIMADGVIQCCGTSLFLKMKYGAGYHLTIVKQPNCDTTQITNVVQEVIPEARMESNVGMELCYILPFESKGHFERLFDIFDKDKDLLKFSSYGISVTTMEEVFLRAGGSVDAGKPPISALKHDSTDSGTAGSASEESPLVSNGAHRCSYSGDPLDFNESPQKNGFRLFQQQFGAMFLKRVLHTARNWLLTVSQLLVPLVLTIIALAVLKTLPSGENQPPLTLNMSKFSGAVVAYGIGDGSPIARDLSEEYVTVLQSVRSLTLVNVSNNAKYDNYSNPVDQYIIDEGEQNLARYNKHFLIALDFLSEVSSGIVYAIAYFSNQAYHASAISLNAIDNAIFRSATGNSTARIVTTNHPLPERVQDSAANPFELNINGFGISMNAVFGMSFLTSSFVLFLIRERASKAKHSQFISGVDFFVFWTSTLAWDLMNYIVPCFGMIIAYAAFGIDAYVGGGRWADVLLLFVLYGWAVLPFMYLLSFIFKVPSTGFIWLTILNIVTGIGTLMAVAILSIPQLETEDLARSLEWIFLVFLPNYCLGQGLSDLYSNYEFNKICSTIKTICVFQPTLPCCSGCKNNCITYNEDYLGIEPNGIGRMLVFLGTQGCCYFGLLLLLESNTQKKIFYIFQSMFKSSVEHRPTQQLQPPEDDDVTNERIRIKESHLSELSASEAIIFNDLTKRYGQFVAVDRICAGIGRAECFGLLGINGAGKTSTFQMLTGDAFISGGTAYVLGHDLKKDFDKIQYEIGYCPQFDALIEQLTGWETLRMYANLRGLDKRTMDVSINSLVDALLLRPHIYKLVKSYSGGTKRKLSTAIALIGRPRVIFLDEPSSGMDPTARRHLWNTLARVRDAGRTLVLTSHSMEECEALCTRIAIMVNGQFRCLGSTQHLKSKFGKGYTLMIKVKSNERSTESTIRQIHESVEASFPGSILKDVHQGLLHFHITDPSVKLGRLFGIVESIRMRFPVEDYSVSQTTLEQVFINFAQTQVAPEDAKGRHLFCENRCGCGSCCGLFRRREIAENESTPSVDC